MLDFGAKYCALIHYLGMISSTYFDITDGEIIATALRLNLKYVDTYYGTVNRCEQLTDLPLLCLIKSEHQYVDFYINLFSAYFPDTTFEPRCIMLNRCPILVCKHGARDEYYYRSFFGFTSQVLEEKITIQDIYKVYKDKHITAGKFSLESMDKYRLYYIVLCLAYLHYIIEKKNINFTIHSTYTHILYLLFYMCLETAYHPYWKFLYKFIKADTLAYGVLQNPICLITKQSEIQSIFTSNDLLISLVQQLRSYCRTSPCLFKEHCQNLCTNETIPVELVNFELIEQLSHDVIPEPIIFTDMTGSMDITSLQYIPAGSISIPKKD